MGLCLLTRTWGPRGFFCERQEGYQFHLGPASGRAPANSLFFLSSPVRVFASQSRQAYGDLLIAFARGGLSAPALLRILDEGREDGFMAATRWEGVDGGPGSAAAGGPGAAERAVATA